jgi:uncharacterized membrane-anchored protein
MLFNKKAQLGGLQGIVITLVVVGVLLGVCFYVLEQFMAQMTAGSQAEAGVNETINAMAKIPQWLPIIVIVAIAGIILAIVFALIPRTTMGAEATI